MSLIILDGILFQSVRLDNVLKVPSPQLPHFYPPKSVYLHLPAFVSIMKTYGGKITAIKNVAQKSTQ